VSDPLPPSPFQIRACGFPHTVNVGIGERKYDNYVDGKTGTRCITMSQERDEWSLPALLADRLLTHLIVVFFNNPPI
jgi:hypothetical protein